jgi:hypothetical protein
MATTYEAIATVTVGSGGASSIEFTSIPGTYTDLLVKTSLRCNNGSAGADMVLVTLNGSTSDFTHRYIINNAGSVASGSNVPRTVAATNRNGTTASTFSNCEFYIPNYAGSNNKSISVDYTTEQNGTTSYFQVLSANLWSNSAAITSIKMDDESGHSFVQYSTATLYGIKNS